jgi:class 3 adenylate cyclase
VDVPETRYAERAGVHVAHQVVGAGERDLFMLSPPPIPIDLMWDDPLLARGLGKLADAGRLIVCDGRGFGSSDLIDPDRAAALQVWMDDIETVLDAVGSERATLIGHLEAAMPAMLFAASHPERVSSLVLIHAAARYLRADDYPCGMPDAVLARLVQSFEREVGRGGVARYYAPSRAADPQFVRWASRGERLSTPPNTVGGHYRNWVRSDVRQVLPSIAAPTLVLHRRDNRAVLRGHAEYLAEHIPQGRLLELPGADNYWFAGDVDGIADEIVAFVTGTRGATASGQRALATIVLTDIVGSTDLAARLGDATWRPLLEKYHELAARYVAGFRGRIVKSTGDGTLATFDGPARGLEYATGLRDAARDIGLRLRTGVHTGEVEVIGDDIAGIAVHICARIAAAAGADEVLASPALPALTLGSRLAFDDRGDHDLKGVPGRWRLYAVAG